MKADSIKVGSKTGTKLDVPVQRPENVADCLTLAKGNEAKVAAFFYRGYCIWLQDAVGRPMHKDGATAADVQQAIAAADPNTTRTRRAPAAPQVVKVDSKKKSYTAAEVAAMLAGIKGVTVATE